MKSFKGIFIHTYIDIYISEYSQNLFQVATLFMLEHVADAPGEYGKLQYPCKIQVHNPDGVH